MDSNKKKKNFIERHPAKLSEFFSPFKIESLLKVLQLPAQREPICPMPFDSFKTSNFKIWICF